MIHGMSPTKYFVLIQNELLSVVGVLILALVMLQS
jgi:hypothetical protein